MNGWGDGEPAWWLNLQARPGVRADLADGPRLVRGRAARGEERDRLWGRWREIDKNLDAYASPPLYGDRGGDPGAAARAVDPRIWRSWMIDPQARRTRLWVMKHPDEEAQVEYIIDRIELFRGVQMSRSRRRQDGVSMTVSGRSGSRLSGRSFAGSLRCTGPLAP